MGIRSIIKPIIANYRTGKITEKVAFDAIEFVVNRPKQKKLDLKPSRAAVAEELISQGGPKHDILSMTLTHHCLAGTVECHVLHGDDTTAEVVALGIASLKEFCIEKLKVDPDNIDITGTVNILKKF